MVITIILVVLLLVSVVLYINVQNKSRIEKLSFQNRQSELESQLLKSEGLVSQLRENLENTKQLNIKAEAETALARKLMENKVQELSEYKIQFETLQKELSNVKDKYSEEFFKNQSLNEKLELQKKEIEELGKKFNLEFENIANRILETKTQKFTELNKENMNALLDPLSKNITEFKKQVEEVYDKESKERFSLADKVKELAQLNQVISEEAKNLTKALKGEAKTQGRWGEMILEKILEMSGLRKDEEYFLEEQLTDEVGKALRSDSEGKKMRPDAIVKYPDNRNVIIDSKVSLNAFSRYIETTDVEEQKRELTAHVTAVKDRIVELSKRGYDDFDKSLDFVMMFIPSEPAYIAALQGEPDLWNFAYEKRILLLNPTNLITSLKLIVDLWRKEYQNKNAQKIAERGAKLYDKFVGFVQNLEIVGTRLEAAKSAYDDAYKQLNSGNDNIVLQTQKLKELGLKNKKELKAEFINKALDEN